MKKYFVFISKNEGETIEKFFSRYHVFQKELEENAEILHYIANYVKEPSDSLKKAGWGNNTVPELLIVDEIWTISDNPQQLYNSFSLLAVYESEEVVLRECKDTWEIGKKSRWIKRMGLLTCYENQRKIDFRNYWKYIHGPKALETHIGAGKYIQNHFINMIEENKYKWDGCVFLYYWNEDAYIFGHMNDPEKRKLIRDDGAQFREKSEMFYVEEYLIK